MDEMPDRLLQLAGSEDAVVDIVFVHGLTGDRESNWTSKNNTFWPKTLLPQSIPNARILTWGWDDKFVFYVDKVAVDLFRDLAATRRHKPDRPIIFVGHDLGAVVCVNAIYLATSDTERDVRHIVDCVRGIIFLGMPHPARPSIKMKDLRLNLSPEVKSNMNHFALHTFLRDAPHLPTRRLRDVLRSREVVNTFEFYEQDDSDFLGNLYTKDMATLPDNSKHLTIPGNHVTMCKFDSSDEPGYIMMIWLLRKWIKELPRQMSGGPADPVGPSIANNVPGLDTPADLRILHRLLGLAKEDGEGTSEDPEGLSKPLLSPETVRWLASKELLSSIQQESFTISTAPLLESFTTSTADLTSTGEDWSLSEDDKPFLRKVVVPIRLYSVETYEFLGYQRMVAGHLWKMVNSSLNPSFSFFEVSKEYLENKSREESDYDWSNFMDKTGICESLRKSILDSNFCDIRSTERCEFWLRTAFEIRWQELNALNEDLLKAMKRTASTDEHRTGSSAPSDDRGTNTEQSESSGHQDTEQPPSEQYSGEKEEKGHDTETDPATKTPDPDTEVVTLLRGGTKTSISDAIDNGTLRLNKIRSLLGDFSGTRGVPYFTLQRQTAERYGAFHVTLSQTCTPPYLLKFQVSKVWLQSLRHRCLWATGWGINKCDIDMPSCPDQEVQGETEDTENQHTKDLSWEHVVFTCRRGGFTPDFLEQDDLLIGHIAKFHTEDIDEMESESGIRDGLLLIDDKPAVQYAFVSESCQRELVVRASGVETECLTGQTKRIYRDDREGRTGVEDVRYISLE